MKIKIDCSKEANWDDARAIIVLLILVANFAIVLALETPSRSLMGLALWVSGMVYARMTTGRKRIEQHCYQCEAFRKRAIEEATRSGDLLSENRRLRKELIDKLQP